MEDIDTTENERETQYISDEEVKAFDCELGEEIKIDLSEDTLEAKKAPTGKSKAKTSDKEEKKAIEPKILSKSGKDAKPVFDEAKAVEEKYKIKQCPNHATYLTKTDDIPKIMIEPKYLSKNVFEKVILTSYPRSGNTLLRKYLEDITGIITGSDCDVRRKLNYDLVEMGMKGEGKVDSKVWVIKSHYPERYGFTKFQAHKCILLVRNPMDAIISLYNMVATGTHNCSISEEDHKEYNGYFDMFISQEIAVWRDFHSYWIDPDPLIPTYIIRYEDLLTKPKDTLMGLFGFLLNNKNLEGTLIEHLIVKHTAKDTKKEVYKPRVGKVNGSKSKYTKDQIDQIKRQAGQMLRRLGYIKGTKLAEAHNTGFYSDDEEVKLSHDYECDSLVKYNTLRDVNMRYRFNEFNDKTLETVLQYSFKDKLKTMETLESIQINYPGDLIRQKTTRDPMGRGSRMFKDILRGNVDVISPDGTVTKSKSKPKPKEKKV